MVPQQQRWLQQHKQHVLLACLLLWASCSQPAVAVLLSQRPGNVLTMILTDCAKYQDWQTIAAAFAWRQSEQPGSVIRVANCNEQDTKNYDKRMLDYVQTHMAKQVRLCTLLCTRCNLLCTAGAAAAIFTVYHHPADSLRAMAEDIFQGAWQ